MLKASCRVCDKRFYRLDLDAQGLCEACARAALEASHEQASEKQRHEKAYHEQAATIMLTTEQSLQGVDVQRLGIVGAECCFGMNVFKEIMMAGRDIFGGRSETIQNAFREGRQIALDELRREVFEAGGNAAIAVSLHHQQIGSENDRILLVTATGTAVRIT